MGCAFTGAAKGTDTAVKAFAGGPLAGKQKERRGQRQYGSFFSFGATHVDVELFRG